MLGDAQVVATTAVKDLETAKHFYEDTLGLMKVDDRDEHVIVFQSGTSKLNVYESEYAGTNQATAVTWAVDDVKAEVKALKAKGVTFEHYDMDGVEMDGDMHVAGDFRMVWFKDPDGNILHLNNM